MKALKKFLGIKHPIIQSPMAGVQRSALAIAVSNAGGLGSLPCAMLSPAELHSELTSLRAGTDKPVNLNFFCHTPPEPDAQREAAWRDLLAPYYDEFAIPQPQYPPSGSTRAPFSREAADLLQEFRPAVVSFHFGLPSTDLVARVKAMGSLVLSTATTVEEAIWLEKHGADAIIAQGLEAGGHRGIFLSNDLLDLTSQMGTFALLPQIVRAVRVPVIAAGGIANARGVAAALALGASAVQIGTAFLLCSEVFTTPIHRSALKSEAARHTAITNLFTGRPARGIVNRIMKERGPISAAVPAFPLAGAALGPLRTKAESLGDGGFSPLWCGQNASGCAELPAAEVVRKLAAGASAPR